MATARIKVAALVERMKIQGLWAAKERVRSIVGSRVYHNADIWFEVEDPGA